MFSFLNFHCFILINLIISIVFSSNIQHNHTNKTFNRLNNIIHRERRQITNTFNFQHSDDLQHPSQHFRSSISVNENECSYKSTTGVCLIEARYRTFDGSCNNLLNPWWGTTHVPFRRLLNANYADGEFLPQEFSVTGIRLPTPREISNICSNEIEMKTERFINDLFTSFAQFLDHDLSSAANGLDDDKQRVICQCIEQIKNPFCLNIPTPDMKDQICMLFPRSSALFQRESSCQLKIREQVNQINSFIDGSMIYGNTKNKSDELRTFIHGQLKTTLNNLPPQTTTDKEGNTCRDAQAGRSCFLCGDTRSNENLGLTSLHTIFLRLHNKIARILSEENSFWSDDIIYYETRRIIIAILQHIVYQEFLPLLIGRFHSNFGFYQYDPLIDPTIVNEFATAAFRFGHTLVNGFVRRYNNQHNIIEEIPLSQVIFRPIEAYNQPMGGLDTLIMGFLSTPASKFDSIFNEILRNHLFEAPSINRQVETKRFDLLAININRGRDHGLPSYNAMRQFCGLPRASSFDDLIDTIDRTTIEKIASIYSHVDDIDLYLGGISERSIEDGIVGPTFACIIRHQFNDLRRGDRFFYETSNSIIGFTSEQLNEIRRMTFSNILCQTVEGITDIQYHAFRMANQFDNQYVSCSSLSILDLSHWRQ